MSNSTYNDLFQQHRLKADPWATIIIKIFSSSTVACLVEFDPRWANYIESDFKIAKRKIFQRQFCRCRGISLTFNCCLFFELSEERTNEPAIERLIAKFIFIIITFCLSLSFQVFLTRLCPLTMIFHRFTKKIFYGLIGFCTSEALHC